LKITNSVLSNVGAGHATVYDRVAARQPRPARFVGPLVPPFFKAESLQKVTLRDGVISKPELPHGKLTPMRAVLQRVTSSRVEVNGEPVGEIGTGLLVLLGVARDDEPEDADYLSDKIVNLRIFADEEGKMNRSLVEIGGAMLAVSQFTLYGDTKKGRRPSFVEAAPPEKANSLYQYFVGRVRTLGVKVETGVFQAMMKVTLTNDGPVTILIDSKKPS